LLFCLSLSRFLSLCLSLPLSPSLSLPPLSTSLLANPEESQRLLGPGAGEDSGDEQLVDLNAFPPPPPSSVPSQPSPLTNIQEPPPVYTPPVVAVPASEESNSVVVNPQPPPVAVATAQIPVAMSAPKPMNPVVLGAPPEYTYHVPPTHYAAAVPVAGAAAGGLPVQVQVDGQTISATLVQDVSWR
jgi:hypothetical protein